MNYCSLSDLGKDVKHLISLLPPDIDLIVGIPRDGLLAANLLALYLGLPLTDVEGFCSRRIFQSTTASRSQWDFSKCKKALVVDDCIGSGETMRRAQETIKAAGLQVQVYYATIYGKTKEAVKVDFTGRIMNPPRLCEWSIPSRYNLPEWCVDIDGVLCRNPSKEEDDDGNKYEQFITRVGLSIRTTKEIGWLVTGRKEKYRALTEQWLKEHGIIYKNLVMFNPDKDKQGRAHFKAVFYQSVNAKLFIESSPRQAEEIARLSGKEVLCLGDNKIYKGRQ